MKIYSDKKLKEVKYFKLILLMTLEGKFGLFGKKNILIILISI